MIISSLSSSQVQIFPVVRLSAGAIDFLYRRRKELSRKFREEKIENAQWPNCELFVPTELCNSGFASSDLNEEFVRFTPNFYLNDIRCFEKPDNRLYHPVKYIGKDILQEIEILKTKLKMMEADLRDM